MARRVDRWLGGWLDGSTDGRVAGWVDGWTGGLLDQPAPAAAAPAGVDIVPSVIAANKESFKGEPRMSFLELDFSQQPLPAVAGAGASAIFSRDALQHLPFALIVGALETFAASSATYLIVGSYTQMPPGSNRQIGVGDYFPINLLDAPFSLPPPLETVAEETPDAKMLLVFRVEDLRKKVDFAAMRARMVG